MLPDLWGTDSQGSERTAPPTHFQGAASADSEPVLTENPEGGTQGRFAGATFDIFVNLIWKRVWITLVYKCYK